MIRHSIRLLAVLFVLSAYAVPSGFAAEAKNSSMSAPLLNKLVSREAAPLTAEAKAKAEADKKENAKKKALLDPSDDDEKVKGTIENVTGEIGAHNNFGLAIELPSDPVTGQAKEAWFNFTSKTKLSGFRTFKDLQDGDTATVTYKHTVTGKKIMKALTFVSHKPKEVPQPEPAAAGSAL